MSLLATTSARLHANSIPARVIAVTAATALTSSVAFGQTFTNLGVLDANHRFSQAVAVSGNGQHVAGNSGVGLFDQMRGFRWSQGSGLTDMGIVPGVNYVALGISNDGSAITGDYQPAGGASTAFRWTSGSGFQLLSSLPGGDGSTATGISSDAQFIAGSSHAGPISRAVRWNGAGAPQDLGVLSGALNSTATAISGNGMTVVGESDFAPFVWTQAGGMQPLPTTGGIAFAVNFDGSVVAGFDGADAARWNNGVLQLLPNLPGTDFASAYAVSGNGLLIGGASADANFNNVATIWSDSLGAVNLNTFLPTFGIDLTGWNLEICTAISFDGNTLVGQGTFNGETRAWHATIPSPGAAAVLGLGGLLAAHRRR
jgi:uncharacterized membrane protein